MRGGIPLTAGLLSAALALAGGPPPRAQEAAPLPAELAGDALPLFLKVYVNGRDVGLVAAFTAYPAANRMSSPRAELTQIGIRVPFNDRREVFLDDLPGLSFRYDEGDQSISFLGTDAALLPRVISATPEQELPTPQRSLGAALNYALSAETGRAAGSGLTYQSLSASLDGWIYSPFGTLGTTGFYNDNDFLPGDRGFVRQETRYEVTNTRRALTFALGDVISSSLPWSRPIRMGGVQLRRDFSLRGDLVTNQLLSFSGSSAVPTTVDVFIDNNRAYSTQMDDGPFTLEDLPAYGGSGEAEIVIRDDQGRVRKRRVSFFSSQNLLKKGVADFSLEAGYARENYGTRSNDYGQDAVFSSSLRYGLTRSITLESHVEAKSDLRMWGLGFTAVPFALGEVSVTTGRSSYGGTDSGFLRGGLRTELAGVEINVSSLRTERGFADLAYATGVDLLGAGGIPTEAPLLEFPTALDVIGLSIPVGSESRSLGLSLIRSDRATTEDLIASASFGTSLDGGRGSISVFGSHNFATDDSRVSLGLSLALGKRTHGRAALGRSGSAGTQGGLYVSRPLGDRVGDYGYGLQLERQGSAFAGSARGEYRGRLARAGAEVQSGGGLTRLRADVEGAVVLTGGGFGLGNTVQDSFALVDVGIADVPVYLQNREIARTGPGGKALVPGLSSFRSNRVSLDLGDLPEGAAPGVSAKDVVPPRRGGAFVDFNATAAPSETVVLRDASGAVLPPGSTLRLNGGSTDFYVGYDGLTWLEGVETANTLRVTTGTGTCTAEFSARPGGDLSGEDYQTLVCR